jgi:hypothetical protein
VSWPITRPVQRGLDVDGRDLPHSATHDLARDIMARVISIEEALELSENALPSAPWLAASLREPVAEADLDRLRQVVAPLEVPDELVALLRWADGQSAGLPRPVPGYDTPHSPWWPILYAGHLLPASAIVRDYEQRRRFNEEGLSFPAILLPFCGDQLSEASLEMAQDRPGVVVDTMYDGPMSVVAPSLAAMLAATADMITSGLALSSEYFDGTHHEWYLRRTAIADARYDQEGWSHWPYAREPGHEPDEWPPEWQEVQHSVWPT